jgi:hypothetical protein
MMDLSIFDQKHKNNMLKNMRSEQKQNQSISIDKKN